MLKTLKKIPGELHHAINLSHPKVIFASDKVRRRAVRVSAQNSFVEKIIVLDDKLSERNESDGTIYRSDLVKKANVCNIKK